LATKRSEIFAFLGYAVGGSFNIVPALITGIEECLNNHNQNPQAFVWSAPLERILAKIAKCKEALDTLHWDL
jgi:hypothetical protein